MAFDTTLAARVREYLAVKTTAAVEEKKLFGGLAFMVDGKMCVNVSKQNLMCRFDPDRTEALAQKSGFMPMHMKGKTFRGYCYVLPVGLADKKDLAFWIDECLDFNARARTSKK